MKKIMSMALAAAFIAAPAFAASMTVSFANDDGTTQEWTLNDDGTAVSGDLNTTYTYDEAAMKLCADIPDAGSVCATFDSAGTAVGDTSTYTLSTGGGGTATITAMEE